MIENMPGYEIKVKTDNIDGVDKWYWPWEDEGLWLGPSQEWAPIKVFIQEHCKSFRTVIQAGGACGMYPRLLSNMFEQVVTFEPDPVNFFFLNLNCRGKNVVKFNCALGDENRWATFHHPANNNRGTGNMTITSVDVKTTGDVLMMRGDTFDYKGVDLVYLDIEGSETLALHGLINTIRKHRPVIICENAHAGPIDFLASLGYQAVARSHSDTVFKIPDDAANQ